MNYRAKYEDVADLVARDLAGEGLHAVGKFVGYKATSIDQKEE